MKNEYKIFRKARQFFIDLIHNPYFKDRITEFRKKWGIPKKGFKQDSSTHQIDWLLGIAPHKRKQLWSELEEINRKYKIPSNPEDFLEHYVYNTAETAHISNVYLQDHINPLSSRKDGVEIVLLGGIRRKEFARCFDWKNYRKSQNNIFDGKAKEIVKMEFICSDNKAGKPIGIKITVLGKTSKNDLLKMFDWNKYERLRRKIFNKRWREIDANNIINDYKILSLRQKGKTFGDIADRLFAEKEDRFTKKTEIARTRKRFQRMKHKIAP